MNPSSDIFSLKNQYEETIAKAFIEINQLVEDKDYKAVFEKLFDLVLFEVDSLSSIYQRQLIGMKILVITNTILT